jgi:hypothetical protein
VSLIQVNTRQQRGLEGRKEDTENAILAEEFQIFSLEMCNHFKRRGPGLAMMYRELNL